MLSVCMEAVAAYFKYRNGICLEKTGKTKKMFHLGIHSWGQFSHYGVSSWTCNSSVESHAQVNQRVYMSRNQLYRLYLRPTVFT
jgi:hypothetical protein